MPQRLRGLRIGVTAKHVDLMPVQQATTGKQGRQLLLRCGLRVCRVPAALLGLLLGM